MSDRDDLLHALLTLAGVPEGGLLGDYVAESSFKAIVLTALTTDSEGNPKREWKRPLPDDKLIRRVAFVAIQHMIKLMEELAGAKEDAGLKGALERLRGVTAKLETAVSPAIVKELRAVEEALAGRVGEVTAWDRIASDD